MSPVQEPVNPTETVTESSTESQANGENTTAQPTETTQETTQQPQTNAELEELRKRLNQAEMRANQLDNQRKEEERKRLEEANEYKTLYEQKLAEDEARKEREEAENSAKSAKELRDSVIDSYTDEKVKLAAQKLVAQNDNLFWWSDDAQTPDDAKAAVKAQLDSLAETFGTPAAPVSEPEVTIDANNPIEGRNAITDEELKAMEARLGDHPF